MPYVSPAALQRAHAAVQALAHQNNWTVVSAAVAPASGVVHENLGMPAAYQVRLAFDANDRNAPRPAPLTMGCMTMHDGAIQCMAMDVRDAYQAALRMAPKHGLAVFGGGVVSPYLERLVSDPMTRSVALEDFASRAAAVGPGIRAAIVTALKMHVDLASMAANNALPPLEVEPEPIPAAQPEAISAFGALAEVGGTSDPRRDHCVARGYAALAMAANLAHGALPAPDALAFPPAVEAQLPESVRGVPLSQMSAANFAEVSRAVSAYITTNLPAYPSSGALHEEIARLQQMVEDLGPALRPALAQQTPAVEGPTM